MAFGPKILGPKCSGCCAVVAAWGIVMFLLLGAFFSVKSPALREDVSSEEDQESVFAAYDNAATNCFIAGGIYVGVLLFSGWQMAVNNSRQYQIA